MEAIDKELLKKVEDLFQPIKTLLGKSEDALKFPHEAIWKNDTIEYLTNAKTKFNDTIDKVPDFDCVKGDIVQLFQTRVNTIQANYSQKLYSVEVDKILYSIKDNLDRADRALDQSHENQWKNDSKEYATKAKELYEAFVKETKYEGMKTRDAMIVTFGERSTAFNAKYTTKLHSKELDTIVYEINDNSDRAERALQQPHPNQYKNDSMEYFGKAKDAVKKLEANEVLAALPKSVEVLAKYKTRSLKFLEDYSSKIYKVEKEQLEYPITNNMDQAERSLFNNRANDAMEYFGNARAAVKAYEENENIKVVSGYEAVLTKFKDRSTKFLADYSNSVYKKEKEQLEYPITNNMDQAQRSLFNNRYPDAMEYFGNARAAVKVYEDNENIKSVAGYQNVLDKFKENSDKFLTEYGEKVYKKEQEQLEYPIKHNMDQAKNSLFHSRYADAMEYYGLARAAVKVYEDNENIKTVAGYQDVLDKFKENSTKFLTEYGEKVYKKEQEQLEYPIKNNLDLAQRALFNNNYNDAMEYFGLAKDAVKLYEANENIKSVDGYQDILTKYSETSTKFLKEYGDKVYKKEQEQLEYPIKHNMDQAERSLFHNRTDDAMEYYGLARAAVKVYESNDNIKTVEGYQNVLDKFKENSDKFLTQYGTVVYKKEKEQLEYPVKHNMDQAKNALFHSRYEDAMEYYGLARAASKVYEDNDNIKSITGYEDVLTQFKENSTKFLTEYSDKVYKKEKEQLEYPVKHNMDQANNALFHSRFNDAMEYYGLAKAASKVYESNENIKSVESYDQVLTDFYTKSDKFLDEYREKVTLKDLEQSAWQITNNIDNAIRSLSSNTESIYANDSMEYYGRAKEAVASFESKTEFLEVRKHRDAVLSKFDAQSSQFLADYRAKVNARALDQAISPIKSLLNDAESTFKKGPPKQWWADGLEKMVKAKQLVKEFEQNDNFKSSVEREQLIEDASKRYDAFIKNYAVVALADDYKNETSTISNAMADAEDKFKKGPPKQWWVDSLEKMAGAKKLLDDLSAKTEYVGLSEEYLVKGRERVSAFYKKYAEVALSYDLKEAITSLENGLSNAKTTFAKGPPKQWWDDAIEQVVQVKGKFKEFSSSDLFLGINERDVFVERFEKELKEFGDSYKQRVFTQELNDAITAIRNKVSDAEATFKKGPPKQWWTDSLEKMVQAKILYKAFEQREDFQGLPVYNQYVDEFNTKYSEFLTNYSTNVLAAEVGDAISSLTNQFDAAESTFKRGPPKEWWVDSLELMARAKLAFATFEEKTEYIGVGKRDQFVIDSRKRIQDFSANYNATVHANEMRDIKREIINALDDADSTFKRGPPKAWWTQSLEKMLNARATYNERYKSRPDFQGSTEYNETVKLVEDRIEAFKNTYATVVLGDEIKSYQLDISAKIAEAQAIFAKGPPRQFWDDSMVTLSRARAQLLEFEAKEEFVGIKSRDEFIVSSNASIKKLEGDYNERVFISDLKSIIEQVKSKIDDAERTFQQGPPRQFWDDSYLKLSKAREFFKQELEDNVNYRSVALRDAFVKEFNDRATKLDLLYKDRVVGVQAREAVQAIQSKLDLVNTILSKGGLVEFWNDALIHMIEAKKLFKSFESNQLFQGLEASESIKSKFTTQLTQFETNYQSKFGKSNEELNNVGKEEEAVKVDGKEGTTTTTTKQKQSIDGSEILYKVWGEGLERLIPTIAVSMDTPPALISVSGSFNTIVKSVAKVINEIRQLLSVPPNLKINLLIEDAGLGSYKLDYLYKNLGSFNHESWDALQKVIKQLENSIGEIQKGAAKDDAITKKIEDGFKTFITRLEDAKKDLKKHTDYWLEVLQVSYRVRWIKNIRKSHIESRSDNMFKTFVIQRDGSKITFMSFNYEDRHEMNRNTLRIQSQDTSKVMNEKIDMVRLQLKEAVEKYGAFPSVREVESVLEDYQSQALSSMLRQARINLVITKQSGDSDKNTDQIERMMAQRKKNVVQPTTQLNIGVDSGHPFRYHPKDEKWEGSVNRQFNTKALFDSVDIPKYLVQSDADRARTQFVYGVDVIIARFFIPEPLKCYPLAIWNTGNNAGKPLYGMDGVAQVRSYNDTHNVHHQVVVRVNGEEVVTPKDRGNQFFTEPAWELYNSDRSYQVTLFKKRGGVDPLSTAFSQTVAKFGAGTHKVEVEFKFNYTQTAENTKKAFDCEQPDYDIDYVTVSSGTFDLVVLENVVAPITPVASLGLQSTTQLPYKTCHTKDAVWDACNGKHAGKFVFSTKKIAPAITAAEAAKFKSDFTYGTEELYARFVIPANLNSFPVGVWAEGPLKGQPIYPSKETIVPGQDDTLNVQVLIDVSINGKKVSRSQNDQSFYLFEGSKLYSKKREFGFFLLHSKGVHNVDRQKRLVPGIFSHYLLPHGAGKHEVKVEARYRIVQHSLNKSQVAPHIDYPNYDTPWSQPIATGTFTINVPANAVQFDFLPKGEKDLQREDLKLIWQTFHTHANFGSHSPPKELVAIEIVQDWGFPTQWETYYKSKTYRDDHGREYTVEKEQDPVPVAWGLDVYLWVFANAENGWPESSMQRVFMRICNSKARAGYDGKLGKILNTKTETFNPIVLPPSSFNSRIGYTPNLSID